MGDEGGRLRELELALRVDGGFRFVLDDLI